MDTSEYGVDSNGSKQGSLTPLSRLLFEDINVDFYRLIWEEVRAERRENGTIADPFTKEVFAELGLMVKHATKNERKKRFRL